MTGLWPAPGAHPLFQPPRGWRALPPGHQPRQRALPGVPPARRAALPHRQAPGDAPCRERLKRGGAGDSVAIWLFWNTNADFCSAFNYAHLSESRINVRAVNYRLLSFVKGEIQSVIETVMTEFKQQFHCSIINHVFGVFFAIWLCFLPRLN